MLFDKTPNQHAQLWVDKLAKLQGLGPVFGMVAGMEFADAKKHMDEMTRDELLNWCAGLQEMSMMCAAMLDAFKTVLTLKVLRELKKGNINLDDMFKQGDDFQLPEG